MQHTPGPWKRLDYSDGKKGFIAVVTDDGAHIADVFPFGSRLGAQDRKLESHRANAALMASAPDFEDALRRILSLGGDHDLMDAQAIAKDALSGLKG